RSAAATTTPCWSIASPLTEEVPTSRPTSRVIAASASRAQRLVHQLVGSNGVLVHLRLPKRGVVDAPRDRVDEPPLLDAPPHDRDGVLGVRIEVEAEPLPGRAVVRAAQLQRKLERLHEGRRADHVVVVERAPARVAVLVAEQALVREQ